MSRLAQADPTIFYALVKAGRDSFGVEYAVGGRLGRGIATLSGINAMSTAVLLWWPEDKPGLYQSLQHNPAARLNLREIFGVEWQPVSWIQFLGVSAADARLLRQRFPDVPYLAEDHDDNPDRDRPMPPAMPDQGGPPADDDMDDVMLDDLQSLGTTRLAEMQSAPGSPPPPPPPPPYPPRQATTTTRSRTPVPTRSQTATPIPPAPPPSYPPPQSPQRSTRSRTPFPSAQHPPKSSASSAPSYIPPGSTKAFFPPPPQGWMPPGPVVPLSPVASQQSSNRSRTPHPTTANQAASSSRQLPREPSEVASTVSYRTPVGSTASVPGSISYPEPLLPFQSFPEPVLPFQDPSGDEDEEDAFVIMKQSPEQLQGWKLNPGLLEAIEEQKRVLAYTVVHTGQVPRISCSTENDSLEIEIGPTLGQLFVGFEHMQPDEV